MESKVIKEDNILVFNAGSATLKWALYETNSLFEIGRGTIERIGQANSFAEWRLQGRLTIKKYKFKNHEQAAIFVAKIIAWQKLIKNISLIGHRIVHGGNLFIKPTLLTAKNIKLLMSLNSLAPLHNPLQVSTIRTISKIFTHIKQIAVFDTAWFANLPEESCFYGLPLWLSQKYNLRRYGFHGLSHSYVAQEAGKILNKSLNQLNLISCHLGSGSSVAAVRAGKPVDISMGFTPLEGLLMCTRAGDLDPGILLYLIQEKNFSMNRLEKILNYDSGLKGIAGVSDMREVMTMAGYEILGFKAPKKYNKNEQKNAHKALKIYLYRLQKYIGAYAAILGKVDTIVFTGGIGERNEIIRNLTMQGLPTLKNIPVLAIPTNEELAIAREIIK